MTRDRKAITLGVSALIVIALVIIVGFGAFLSSTLNTTNNNHNATGSVASQSYSSSSSQGSNSSNSSSQSYSATSFRVINSNLTVYYGTACIVVELFQLSCLTMNAAMHSPSLSNVELVSSEGFYYYAINFTFYLGGQPISHTVWFTNSSVICVSPEYGSYNACPSQVQLTETFVIPISVNSSLNAAMGLRLDLNLSTDPSAGLIVKLDEYNTLDSSNNVTVANQWPIPKNNLTGYCMTNMMGYAVYQGNYEINNYTSGDGLALNPPNVQINCPSTNPPASYLFSPKSNVASISNQSNFPRTVSTSIEISESNSVAGYWSGTMMSPLFNSFPQGVYTVVAADEWGQIVILHFTVSSHSTKTYAYDKIPSNFSVGNYSFRFSVEGMHAGGTTTSGTTTIITMFMGQYVMFNVTAGGSTESAMFSWSPNGLIDKTLPSPPQATLFNGTVVIKWLDNATGAFIVITTT